MDRKIKILKMDKAKKEVKRHIIIGFVNLISIFASLKLSLKINHI